MTQEELREVFRECLKREKQCYIAKQTGINISVLSQYKHGHIDLPKHRFEKLEAYLLDNNHYNYSKNV